MAYNEKAWNIVEKYLPTHYLGSTGPCCDHCSRLYRAVIEAQTEARSEARDANAKSNGEAYKLGYEGGKRNAHVDDPDMDGTDFAHPAWWRGHEYSFARSCKEINDILDGTKANVGASTQPWQQLRQRLYDVRTLLGIAELIINTVHTNTLAPGLCHTTIMRWFKIRADYSERLKVLAKEKK